MSTKEVHLLHFRKATLISLLFGLVLLMTLFLVSGFPGLTPPSAAAAGGNLLVNPGFEADGATDSPTGWDSIGDDWADFTEPGDHSGDYRLSHWNGWTYQVATSQTITNLENGPARLG